MSRIGDQDLGSMDDMELAEMVADLECDFAMAEALLIRAQSEVSNRRRAKRRGYVRPFTQELDTSGKKPN